MTLKASIHASFRGFSGTTMYSYGLDGVTRNAVNNNDLKGAMKSLMTEELCIGGLSGLFPSGLRYYRALYYAKGGELLFGFAISKDDCKPHSKYGEIDRRFMELIDGKKK